MLHRLHANAPCPSNHFELSRKSIVHDQNLPCASGELGARVPGLHLKSLRGPGPILTTGHRQQAYPRARLQQVDIKQSVFSQAPRISTSRLRLCMSTFRKARGQDHGLETMTLFCEQDHGQETRTLSAKTGSWSSRFTEFRPIRRHVRFQTGSSGLKIVQSHRHFFLCNPLLTFNLSRSQNFLLSTFRFQRFLHSIGR